MDNGGSSEHAFLAEEILLAHADIVAANIEKEVMNSESLDLRQGKEENKKISDVYKGSVWILNRG